MPKIGKFIAVEGGDGSGKSALITRLFANLPVDKFVFTQEPGSKPIGTPVRLIFCASDDIELGPLVRLLLIEAERFAHLAFLVLPALVQGKHVVSSRFNASTYTYQVVAGKGGWKVRLLFHLLDWFHGIRPDHWIWLDIDPEVARMRKHGQKKADGKKPDRLEQKKVDFHRLVRDGYRKFFRWRRNHTRIDTEKLNEVETFEVAREAIRNVTGI